MLDHVGPSILPLGLALPMGLGTPACLIAEGWEHFRAKAAFPVGPVSAPFHLRVPHDHVTVIAGMGQ